MIIDDLDAFRRAFAPDEAESPLIVDPDAILTLPVAAQSLKPGIVQHPKLPPCHGFNVAESAVLLTVKEILGLLAAEGSYHTGSITRWPLDIEPQTVDHLTGMDNAGFILFTTCAYLDMAINTELGACIHGSPLPEQVERHFDDLIARRIYRSSNKRVSAKGRSSS